MWAKLSTDKANCLGRNCHYIRECPFYIARKEIESAIVLAELFSGVTCMPDGKRQRDLKLKLADALELKFEGQILPFDGLCAMQYAELTARNRLLGKAMSVPDAQIAATCLHYGAALATRNTKDFLHCGIELIDPWQAPTGRRLHEDAAEYYVMSRKS
ncbi:PIN domain-containing protein [Serratia sp. CY74664]|uniref:type II toxin-antitoxin system VapC family toxin n=1 Tax=Serratia sp. CY74664 TaxID=3383676 RepID=UPI003F9F542B